MSFNFATCFHLFPLVLYILILFFNFKIPTVLHMCVCIMNKLMLTKLLTLVGRLNQNLIVILCHTLSSSPYACKCARTQPTKTATIKKLLWNVHWPVLRNSPSSIVGTICCLPNGAYVWHIFHKFQQSCEMNHMWMY